MHAFVCRRISREGNWSTCATRLCAFILIAFEIAFDEGGFGRMRRRTPTINRAVAIRRERKKQPWERRRGAFEMQNALMADENVKEKKNWKVIRLPLIYCNVRQRDSYFTIFRDIFTSHYADLPTQLELSVCVCLPRNISHAIQKVYVCNFEHCSRAFTGFKCESVSICKDSETAVAAANNSHRLQSIFIPSVGYWPQPNAISFDWKWIFDDAGIANGVLSSGKYPAACRRRKNETKYENRNDFASGFKITSGCFELRHVTFVSSFDWMDCIRVACERLIGFKLWQILGILIFHFSFIQVATCCALTVSAAVPCRTSIHFHWCSVFTVECIRKMFCFAHCATD